MEAKATGHLATLVNGKEKAPQGEDAHQYSDLTLRETAFVLGELGIRMVRIEGHGHEVFFFTLMWSRIRTPRHYDHKSMQEREKPKAIMKTIIVSSSTWAVL